MSRFALISLMSASVLAAACSKDDKKSEDKSSGGTSGKASEGGKPAKADPAPAPAPKADGPFAAWDLEGRRKAMQGAHVTPGDSLGTWQAWDVQGDKVVVWDGTNEQTMELSVPSPCEVKTTVRSSDGSSSGTTSHYTLKDGVFITGLGDAGSLKGAEAVACISNKVFTLDAAGTCLEWDESMFDKGKYESAPGTCGWKTEGGEQVFVATVNGHETTLQVHGDALLSEQLARTHSEKVADFAAAKAARDAKK